MWQEVARRGCHFWGRMLPRGGKNENYHRGNGGDGGSRRDGEGGGGGGGRMGWSWDGLRKNGATPPSCAGRLSSGSLRGEGRGRGRSVRRVESGASVRADRDVGELAGGAPGYYGTK